METNTTSSETLSQLKFYFETAQTEYAKFIAGNNSASTRTRKALQEVMRLAKVGRKEVTDLRNERLQAKKTAAV